MSKQLPPAAFFEIRRNITEALKETFQMMFHLDVFTLPQIQFNEEYEVICAHMCMINPDSKIVLSIAVTRDLVEFIAMTIDPSVRMPSPPVVQDIVCEINNIIGNHLKTYINENVGIDFEMNLPKAGALPKDSAAQTFDLHFRIRKDDEIDLSFTYMPTSHHAIH